MRKIFMALLAVVFAHTALAQSFVQEASFSDVTRRTGGAEYVITINQPTKQLYLNLEAELNNPALSSHKLQIHSIKYLSASGAQTALSNKFLIGNDPKLSLELNSDSNIVSVTIIAESWRSYHGMYVSLEGIVAQTTNTDVEDNQQSDDTVAEERRRQADEQARRDAEVNAEIERRRQVQCAANFNSIQRRADRCISYDLRDQLDVYTQTNRRFGRLQNRLVKDMEPLNACNKRKTAGESQVTSKTARYTALAGQFQAEKNAIRGLKVKAVEATGNKFRCTLSNVGKKKRGTYIGEGATKGQALMAAFKLCPNRQKDGCGDGQKKLRAETSCVRVN